MNKILLKIYLPLEENPEKYIPVEVESVISDNFDNSVKRIKENWNIFVEQLLEDNKDFKFIKDINKCKFEKIIIQEIKIENI